MTKIHTPTKLAVQRAQNTLLRGAYWPAGLEPRETYTRRHDDTDGGRGPEQDLEITIGPDGDVWVRVGAADPLRFRTHPGGGRSWHTRNALLLVAEGMRRDQAERPDHTPTT